MKLENLYQEIILDHYKHPHGKGLKDSFDAQVQHVNPVCGDEITVQVHMESPESDAIVVSYDVHGCSISQASASIMFDQIDGLSFEDGMKVVDHFVAVMQREQKPDEDVLGDGIALEGVAAYPARVKCALLSWMAWKDAAIQATGNEGA